MCQQPTSAMQIRIKAVSYWYALSLGRVTYGFWEEMASCPRCTSGRFSRNFCCNVRLKTRHAMYEQTAHGWTRILPAKGSAEWQIAFFWHADAFVGRSWEKWEFRAKVWEEKRKEWLITYYIIVCMEAAGAAHVCFARGKKSPFMSRCTPDCKLDA